MTYRINNIFKNHKPVLLLIFFIICLMIILRNKVFANDFKLQRRDIKDYAEQNSNSVSINMLDVNILYTPKEKIDGIRWYIDKDTLYIEKTTKCRTKVVFDRYYDCPWNKYEYNSVKVEGGIGVRLWYFSKGKARKCGKM